MIRGFRYAVDSTGTGTVNPAVVQLVSSSTNQPGLQGQAGSNFKFTLPNKNGGATAGNGNCIVLCLSYASGTAITITDSIGNSWPTTAAVSVNSGSIVSSIWILPNATGGAYATYHVACSPASIPFQYDILELCGIDANPVNGTAGTASVTGPNLATGSFTPTSNNDVNGGNVILAYYALNTGSGASTPSSWSPGSGFTLLEAGDLPPTQSFGHALQMQVQTSQAIINPGMTATGSTDAYNCVAVALKVNRTKGVAKPGAGTQMWINSIQHFSTNGVPASWVWQTPFVGDMRVLALSNASNAGTDFTFSDSEGSTWTKHGGASDGTTAITAETAGKSPNTALKCTIGATPLAGNPMSGRFFDISNASSTPFDNRVAAVDPTTFVTVRNDFPDITPTTSNGLVIANGACGIGPATGFNTGTPANAVFDLCTYPEETDGSSMENADMLAHYFNPNTNLITWNWTVTSTNAGANIVAVAYKHA